MTKLNLSAACPAAPPIKRGVLVLRDLARLADADVSTVSRALNHDPRVSSDRAKHIRQLAKRVGYRPQPLRSKSSRSIGLLIGSSARGLLGEDYLERIAWYVQRLLSERRLHMNLECIPRDEPLTVPAVVQQNRVDGVLLAGHLPPEMMPQLRELNMPAVAINDSVERLGISCVRSDPGPAIHEAILQLAARGHERFAMILRNAEYPTSQAKYRSYLSTLRDIGIEPQPEWLVTNLDDDIAGGRDGIQELMNRGLIPSAVLCENDWVAVGAIHQLQRSGISVPQNVSVMGHDDLWLCEQTEPKLTSIHRAERELVEIGLSLLLEQVDGRGPVEPQEVLVRGEMVWRESTASAPDRRRA